MDDANKLFSLDLGTELKGLSLQSTSEDHVRLKELAQESGLTQGQVLRLLISIVDLETSRPGSKVIIDESVPLSKMERFLLLSALFSGLFTKEQLDVVIAFAQHTGSGPAQSAMRIDAILKIMKKNMEKENTSPASK